MEISERGGTGGGAQVVYDHPYGGNVNGRLIFLTFQPKSSMLAPPIVLLRTLSQRLYARLTKAVQRKQTHSQSTVTWKSTWKLVLINTGTCCVLYAAGDFCRQKIESNHDSTDWYRTGRMGLLGCCLGPLDSLWYTALDRFLPAVTAAAVARKVLLDQLIMAPICCTLFYLGIIKCCIKKCVMVLFDHLGMSAMEGCNRQESVQELKIKFWPTYKVT